MYATLFSLIAATAISATEIPYKSFSNVTIVALGKTKNETGGEGHVAAAGILPPFGSIGVGCGVNWDVEKEGYGGKRQTQKSLLLFVYSDWVYGDSVVCFEHRSPRRRQLSGLER